VTLVERQDAIRSIAACEDDDRGIGESDTEVCIPSCNSLGRTDVLLVEAASA
jgi:hypothetical protein